MKQLWQQTEPVENIICIAKRLLDSLQHPFCLWLHGEPGAGKSTITRTMLYDLGLDRRIPVQSPTYTYINEYTVGGKNFAHMDLYRIGDDGFQDDLEWVLDRKFDGIFLEWPPESSCDLIPPTHTLKIIPIEDGNSREYTFFQG